MAESIEQTAAHSIRDGIVEAHLRMWHDLSAALRIGDAWDGLVVINASDQPRVTRARNAQGAALHHHGSSAGV